MICFSTGTGKDISTFWVTIFSTVIVLGTYWIVLIGIYLRISLVIIFYSTFGT
jgi:hypothetical protein